MPANEDSLGTQGPALVDGTMTIHELERAKVSAKCFHTSFDALIAIVDGRLGYHCSEGDSTQWGLRKPADAN